MADDILAEAAAIVDGSHTARGETLAGVLLGRRSDDLLRFVTTGVSRTVATLRAMGHDEQVRPMLWRYACLLRILADSLDEMAEKV